MVQKHMEGEQLYEKQQKELATKEQQKQFNQELEKNDKVKQEMMDRFKESMKNSNLTPTEQAAMLAEMNAKIT